MTTADVLFALLGVVAAGSGMLAVSTRNLVHSALWLTVTMAALSGCYLVLGAELVALVQLLVYVGAIVVLVLFALMLTRSPVGRSEEHSVGVRGRLAAFVVASATTGLLLAAFVVAFGRRTAHLDAGSSVNLAQHLFAEFTWPFEVLSLVLLAALVGALAMVTQPEPDEPTRTDRDATQPPAEPAPTRQDVDPDETLDDVVPAENRTKRPRLRRVTPPDAAPRRGSSRVTDQSNQGAGETR